MARLNLFWTTLASSQNAGVSRTSWRSRCRARHFAVMVEAAIFQNSASCLRLTRALAIETHESWPEATRYLNMEHLKEAKKENLRALAA